MITSKKNAVAIIMAAGKGTRMRSPLPKVLHAFRGAPLLSAALAAASANCEHTVVVVGHEAEMVKAILPAGVTAALQAQQLGTGHAVQCALAEVPVEAGLDRSVIVLPGDHPRITAASIGAVIAQREALDVPLAMATVKVPDFDGDRESFADFGRIVRNAEGTIAAIAEMKDVAADQQDLREVNVSVYCFRESWLRENVAQLTNDNAAGEFYLTALIAKAFEQGFPPVGVELPDYREGLGVNSPEQLAVAENA